MGILPTASQDIPVQEILRPPARKQTNITDFMSSVVCPPVIRGQRTKSVADGQGYNAEHEERILAQRRDVDNKDNMDMLVDKGYIEDQNNTKSGSKDSNIVLEKPERTEHPETSMGQTDETVCEADSRGHCKQHKKLMTKLKVTSKKWGLLSKGRGYGYKNVKVTKYICREKNMMPNISNSGEHERFRDFTTSSENNRVCGDANELGNDVSNRKVLEYSGSAGSEYDEKD